MANDQNSARKCWVCLGTEEDDHRAEWRHPCRCRGSVKWVHKSCLKRWVGEKQQGDRTASVACPMCTAEYHIQLFPNPGPVVRLLGLARRAAVNYGAPHAIMQEVWNVMEEAYPLVMFSTISIVYILARMEDYALRLWWKHFTHPIILNFPEEDED